MNKRWLYALFLLAAVLLLALIWRQRPINVVTGAVEMLGEAQTQKFTATLNLTGAGGESGLLASPSQVQLTLNGAFERRAEARDSLASNVKLATVTEGLTLNLEGEARFIDDSAFLLITKSPQAFPLLFQLKDKWLALPRGGTAENNNPPAANEELFTQVQRVDDHYEAAATSQAVVSLLDAIADILGTRLTAEQIDNLRANVASLESVPVKIYVSTFRHELNRLEASLKTPDGNNIDFTFEPKERNQPVDIAAPENAVTLEEALQP